VIRIRDQSLAFVLDDAMELPALKPQAVARLPSLEVDQLSKLLGRAIRSEYVEAALVRLESTDRLTEVRDLRQMVLPAVFPNLTPTLVSRLVGALTANFTVRRYTGWLGLVDEVLEGTRIHATAARGQWRQVYDQLCDTAYQNTGTHLRLELRAVFPDWQEPTWNVDETKPEPVTEANAPPTDEARIANPDA
jgi:hypothetical protein